MLKNGDILITSDVYDFKIYMNYNFQDKLVSYADKFTTYNKIALDKFKTNSMINTPTYYEYNDVKLAIAKTKKSFLIVKQF